MGYYASLEDANNCFSDLYKDTHGFRPYMNTSGWSLQDFNEYAEVLQDEISIQMANEREAKEIAVKNVRKDLVRYKGYGAGDTATAIRWMLEADDVHNVHQYSNWTYNSHIHDTKFDSYLRGMIKRNRIF
jgi:hypothetical protein